MITLGVNKRVVSAKKIWFSLLCLFYFFVTLHLGFVLFKLGVKIYQSGDYFIMAILLTTMGWLCWSVVIVLINLIKKWR